MNCPHCGVSWVGGEIPEDIRHYYDGTHWMRQIGIDGGYIGVYDGVVAYRCPDCGEDSPRNDSAWAKELFEKYQRVVATDSKMEEVGDRIKALDGVVARNKDGV